MKSWTFETKEIAENFDAHVREQLPWYEMVTDAVCYIVRNYLAQGQTIIDVGASTGNTIHKLMPLIEERDAKAIAIEKSSSMVDIMNHRFLNAPRVRVKKSDVTMTILPKGQVYIVFLTLMFIPVHMRKVVIDDIRSNCMEGGVIIIVDKVCDHGGYLSTVLKRLGMRFKLQQGAEPEDVLNKEMSLAGVQIPLDPAVLGNDAKQFFRMGEFAGWIIEN
jgi:tRNA (cmo5U34)-methyltransferase